MIPPSDVIRLGRYLLFDRIASGGMASVHLGRLLGEVGFARIVAIKRMHPNYAGMPELVAMFTDEARIAARVRHPNVVATLDVVSGDGELFLVMEYVHGESLSRLWRAATQAGAMVPLPIAVAIVTGALYGLHAAHEARSERGEPLGLVHRDISPQNILVDTDGVARVLDFGIAKATWRLQTTREGQIKGKLTYMAPEQMKGQPVDRRADIYAVSLVLWELLTGVRYADPGDAVLVMKKILEGTPAPPGSITPGIPPALDDLVLRGLSRDSADRFATAKDMAAALEAIVPPATPREVGEWVQTTASAWLERRAELIAEIESQELSAAAPAEAPAPQHAAPTPASEAPTFIPTPATPAPRTPAPHTPSPYTPGPHTPSPYTPGPHTPSHYTPGPHTPASEGPTFIPTPPPASSPSGFIPTPPASSPSGFIPTPPASSPSGFVPTSPPASRPSGLVPPHAPAYEPSTEILPGALPPAARSPRAGLLLACAAGAFLLLLGAGALVVLGLRSPEPTALPATSAAPTPSAPTPLPSVAAPPSTTTPAPPSTTAPEPSPVPASPSTASASASAPSGQPPRPTRPQPAKPSCDPPYFITKDGTKKYKLECL